LFTEIHEIDTSRINESTATTINICNKISTNLHYGKENGALLNYTLYGHTLESLEEADILD
jgi:hypothetical protein